MFFTRQPLHFEIIHNHLCKSSSLTPTGWFISARKLHISSLPCPAFLPENKHRPLPLQDSRTNLEQSWTDNADTSALLGLCSQCNHFDRFLSWDISDLNRQPYASLVTVLSSLLMHSTMFLHIYSEVFFTLIDDSFYTILQMSEAFNDCFQTYAFTKINTWVQGMWLWNRWNVCHVPKDCWWP